MISQTAQDLALAISKVTQIRTALQDHFEDQTRRVAQITKLQGQIQAIMGIMNAEDDRMANRLDRQFPNWREVIRTMPAEGVEDAEPEQEEADHA